MFCVEGVLSIVRPAIPGVICLRRSGMEQCIPALQSLEPQRGLVAGL